MPGHALACLQNSQLPLACLQLLLFLLCKFISALFDVQNTVFLHIDLFIIIIQDFLIIFFTFYIAVMFAC